MSTQKSHRLPSVHVSIVQKAAAQTALLASTLVSILTLVAFFVARGLLEQGDSADAFLRASSLAAVLLGSGGALIVLAALLARVLARRLTDPLVHVVRGMTRIGPECWKYKRSVHTGDEVELLDAVAADMTRRLERVYEHLEEEVQSRTEELKVQYQKDRTILQSIQHGIIVTDAEGVVTDMNAAAETLMNMEAASMKGKRAEDGFHLFLHGSLVSKAEHPVRSCLHKHVSIVPVPNVHWSIQRGTGELVPVMLTVTPVMRGRSVVGAITVFYDVTDERRVDYLKSEFIALASHQLRTPLSAIEWYIELFTSDGEEPLSASQEEYLKEMRHAATRMVNLVDALLRAAHLEGGTITPTKKRVDLGAIVAELGEEFRSLSKDKKIGCAVHTPRETVSLDTDPVLLHVVLQNLFSNAVKYTAQGGRVELSLETGSSYADISVRDTGIGIPKEDQKRLFEKLFRAENARAIDTDGNGLGLYISRMVMESLGGSIDFRSIEGKGTTFTIRLPKQVVSRARH